jgi:hypothetical protein
MLITLKHIPYSGKTVSTNTAPIILHNPLCGKILKMGNACGRNIRDNRKMIRLKYVESAYFFSLFSVYPSDERCHRSMHISLLYIGASPLYDCVVSREHRTRVRVETSQGEGSIFRMHMCERRLDSLHFPQVLESCESILMSPRPPNFELTNRTLDILGTDFCDQQAIQTNISLLNFDQKQKTTNTLIYKPG